MKFKATLTHPLFVTLAALFCCALWGSATPFIKIGYELLLPKRNVASTILFAGVRFTSAGILTVLIYSIARRRLIYPKKENLWMVGSVSAFQTVIQYICFYLGLSLTSGVKGTLLSGCSAFFAILVSTLVFKMEKLTARQIVACIVGFSGMLLVNLTGLELTINLGDVLVLLSAVSLAFSSVLMKRFSRFEDPVVLSGYQFILGGLVMTLGALAFGGRISITSPKAFFVLLYLAMLSAAAYAVWGVLLQYNPVSRVTVFSFMTPVFGVLLSMLMLRSEESLVSPVNLIFALVLVSMGILILNYRHVTRAVVAQPAESSDKAEGCESAE